MQEERLSSAQLAQSSGFQSPASEMTSDEEDREAVSWVCAHVYLCNDYCSAIRHLVTVMTDLSNQELVSTSVLIMLFV